jgi:hypothetical protein
MLLVSFRNTLIGVTSLLGLLGITYLSKPDRGGLNRCKEIFGFDSLDQRDLEIYPMLTWKPFEGAKFKMKIKKNRFEAFKKYLHGHGYREWKEGGLEYGSFIIGCDGSAPVQYSFNKFGGHEQIIAYDRTNNFIYAINFQ